MLFRVFHHLVMAPGPGWGQQKRGWGSFLAEHWAGLCADLCDCGLWVWAMAGGWGGNCGCGLHDA